MFKIHSGKISTRLTVAVLLSVILSVAPLSLNAQVGWYPYPVEVWDPPFDMASPRKTKQYVPLKKAAQAWQICVSLPHMKDAYWVAVDYGLVSESQRLGVKMQLVEAGGYANLKTQILQIEDCVARGAEAVVIASISYDGMNQLVSKIRSKGIPVIDLCNGMSSKEVSAKSLVSFGEMGYKAGEYIAKLHPAGSGKVKVAWFPGPSGAGWAEDSNNGFQDAVLGSDIEVVATLYGDTQNEAQLKLVEEALAVNLDIQYIAGTGVTAEVAVDLLRARGLSNSIKLVANYITPGVYQGIKSGQIMAAPTDSAVIQGRIAIDQAVRILEGKTYEKHVGPVLYMIDSNNITTFDRTSSLAKEGFSPVFSVK